MCDHVCERFSKGYWYDNVTAQTDAGSLVDAAVATFANGSSVDSQRSAGIFIVL